jgi:hypothetical protein
MNNAPKKKYSPRLNTYIKNGDITYIVTRNLPPQTVIIDTCDVKKVNMYSWSAHPHLNDIKSICHRYRTTDGKWHSVGLAGLLGYGRGWKHLNGNLFDFRKENMAKINFFQYSPHFKRKYSLI